MAYKVAKLFNTGNYLKDTTAMASDKPARCNALLDYVTAYFRKV